MGGGGGGGGAVFGKKPCIFLRAPILTTINFQGNFLSQLNCYPQWPQKWPQKVYKQSYLIFDPWPWHICYLINIKCT